MGLYKLFSCNVEVQYKSFFLSKAMFLTLITSILSLLLPFILAYRSRGFWLKSHNIYEQPKTQFTFEYLLVAETEDPSQPVLCGDLLDPYVSNINEESCAEIEVKEHDFNNDGKNDELNFAFHLNLPTDRTVSSIIVFLGLDFQLQTVCPLQMQSLAVINREFVMPPSGLNFYGDLNFYQVEHLPCLRNHIDVKYNHSVLQRPPNKENVVDFVMEEYFKRKVITEVRTKFSRSLNGHTGNLHLQVRLRVPEMSIHYTPSLLQELKWAWPQYLSLVVIFHWIFNRVKRFVFNNRLVMAWETVTWKKR